MKKGRKKLSDSITDAEFAEESTGVLSGAAGVITVVRDKFREAFPPREHEKGPGGIRGTAKYLVGLAVQYRVILIRLVLPAVYCLIFGGTDFEMGIYPFGISAVCASASGTASLIAAASAAASSLFVRGGFYIAAACAASAASLALIRKIKGASAADGAALRGALSMIMGAAQAIIFSLSDGIGFYELCGIFLSAALCPALTVALRGLFLSAEKTAPTAEAGIYALLYTCAYFLRILSPAGTSVSTVISMLGTLFASYAFGIRKGVMTGVAFGLAADPRYSIIYAVAAAGSGVLMSVSPISAVLAGVLLAMSFGVYSGGASAFGELFPEFMFCAAVAGPLLHYNVIPVPGRSRNSSDSGEHTSISEIRIRRTKDRLRSISESLRAISSVMKKMSQVLCRPSYTEIRQMCDEAFDESCQACSSRFKCWDKEYRSTASAVTVMASAVRNGNMVNIGSLPEGIRSRCPHADTILSRINVGGAAAVRTAASTDSTAALADDYAAISRLIGEISDEGDKDFEYDPEASRALSVRLTRIGVSSAEVSVYGKRRKRVFVRGLELGCNAVGEEIRTAAGSVLGCSMSMPEYRIDGRQVTMNLHTAERFAISFGRCSVAKRGERCGDSITSFRGDGGYFYALISDGMGSGGDAALTSGVSAMFLERMLGSGCTLTSAMEMLNSFLSRRNMECFTTVDLMEADLVTGELRFVKSGAAPSFVLRDGKLFKLSSQTVPVGIVTPYDAEQLRFSAKAGDFIIMLSDGVVPDGGECPWLYDLLCGTESKPFLVPGCDLKSAASEIAYLAANEHGHTDDVTVGIVEIKEV